MITIIDYGMGNLRSVQKAFESVGANAVISDSGEDILKANKIVLPGVGAFDDTVEELQRRNLFDLIVDQINKGKPFLGLCVGFQVLFDTSEESNKNLKGFGVIPGKVCRFSSEVKVPHMGWNQIEQKKDCPYLKGIENNAFVYFVHSYYAQPQDSSVVATETEYGVRFASSVYKENIFATQFHPEKSQAVGLKIIENFSRSV